MPGLNRAVPIIKLATAGILAISILFGCTSDSEEMLLRNYKEQDSLVNKIPSIALTSPTEGDTVQLPLILRYSLTNWQVAEGGLHLQYFIDEQNKGIIYNSTEAIIDKVDTGHHTISLWLARTDFRTIPVYDQVSVQILPPLADTYILTITGGSGSGAFTQGTEVSIAADPPQEGYQFSQWVGDTTHLTANRAETILIMPDQNINLQATYEEILIDYALEIAPIITSECLACHDGLFEPNLSTCNNLSDEANMVAIKIEDQMDPMPPTGLMDQNKIDLILKWIDQGANCNN